MPGILRLTIHGRVHPDVTELTLNGAPIPIEGGAYRATVDAGLRLVTLTTRTAGGRSSTRVVHLDQVAGGPV
jgi:hypothetical protein